MKEKVKFLQQLHVDSVDIVIEQYHVFKGQYDSAQVLTKVFADNDADVHAGEETVKRLTRARIRYNVVVDVVNALFVHYNEALKKEQALSKSIIETAKKDYEDNGPQKTSEEEEDSEES
jgi:hypothetical protein